MKLIKIFSLFLILVGLLSFLPQLENNISIDVKKEVDFTQLNYTAIGDSITEGSLNEDKVLKTGYSYPEVVGHILKLKNVYNMGICGSTIGVGYKPMYERYKGIPFNSDIISIAGGNNDSNAHIKEIGSIDDFTGYTFYGALNIVVRGVLKRYPKAFVFLITRGPWDDCKTSIGTKYSDYVNATKKIGEKYNLPVIDIFNNQELYEDVKSNNNSHPSIKAMENILGPEIANFIKLNYK